MYFFSSGANTFWGGRGVIQFGAPTQTQTRVDHARGTRGRIGGAEREE